jgi:hypothetical protein
MKGTDVFAPKRREKNVISVLFGMLMYLLFAVATRALAEWLDRKLFLPSHVALSMMKAPALRLREVEQRIDAWMA